MKALLLCLLLLTMFLVNAAVAENAGFNSVHFAGSGNCTSCHNGLTDAQSNDISIETAWSSTMMAHSAKDPFWRAKVRSELNRNPQLSSTINYKCSRCHMPMANVEAEYAGDLIEIFDSGFVNEANAHHDEALGGVSCTLCHKIEDNGKLGTLEGYSGHYEIGDQGIGDSNRSLYGPYGDVGEAEVDSNNKMKTVNYKVSYSAHIKASKLCAACHNLKTPYVDENGAVLSTTLESEFPEQMIYSEWEHSDYNTTNSCQDCHMQRVDGVKIATGNPPVRDNFAQHIFVGGNKTLLDIINTYRDELDVTATSFETTIARTDAMLKSAATLEVLNPKLQNGVMEVKVRVNSNTGHKLPAGYPARRAWLHVTVLDENENVVFESGQVNSDGSIVGANADADRTTYEPHYTLIDSQDEVQIYEAVMGNNQGDVTYTLLRGMEYKKDNRLLPTGFDKATASSDIAVHGAAATDRDFTAGSDTVTYRISGLEDATYTFKAELLYQSVGYAFAQDLFTDSSDETAAFQSMFNASTMKTSQIAEVLQAVDATSPGIPPSVILYLLN